MLCSIEYSSSLAPLMTLTDSTFPEQMQKMSWTIIEACMQMNHWPSLKMLKHYVHRRDLKRNLAVAVTQRRSSTHEKSSPLSPPFETPSLPWDWNGGETPPTIGFGRSSCIGGPTLQEA